MRSLVSKNLSTHDQTKVRVSIQRSIFVELCIDRLLLTHRPDTTYGLIKIACFRGYFAIKVCRDRDLS